MSNRTIPQNVKGAAITFTVKIDGRAIPRTFEVYAVNVINDANRVPSAKLTLIDGDPAKEKFSASNDALFLPGKQIELFAGQMAHEDLIFKGVIIKQAIAVRRNGSSQLKLDCRDAIFSMTVGRKSAYYNDVKDSDIANNILSTYKVSVSSIEETSYVHPGMVQYDCSDWDFLLGRMDVNGKLVLVNNGKVDIKSPDFSPKPVLSLLYGATIHEFDAEMDVRNQYSEVKTVSWDASSQEVMETDAQIPSKVKENGNFSTTQLAEANGTTEHFLRYGGNLAREEIQAWGDAFRQKSIMAKIRGRVSFDGFAKIKPGDLIELQGLGDRFNGKVFVSGVRQDISNGIWQTTAQFGMDPEWFSEKFQINQSASRNLVPPIQGLHTGIVAQLAKDPAGEDRILLKLPVVDMAGEGIWARVATLDAGNNRGSFFRPDIGDEVLVGFINDDPRQAIVLGMMNSSTKPSPLAAKDDNKEKGFFFASKMKMLFQEEDKSMTFETPGGNKIVLSEKEKGITIQDQNGNKLVMNEDGISLESSKKITIKTSGGDLELNGINIKQTASAQFKAEGTAGIEVSSGAIAKLKGSMVMIN